MKKETVEIIWSELDNGYMVYHQKERGISAFGDTISEAFKEFGVAFELYLEVKGEDNV